MSKHNTQLTLSGFKGPLNQLIANLIGTDHERWFKLLKKFLRKEETWQINRFKIKGILKSNGEKNIELSHAVLRAGCALSDKAMYCINCCMYSYGAFEAKIVALTPKELGFENGASYFDVLNRAEDFGFDLCPHAFGPELAMQGKDFFDLREPKMIYVATEFLVDAQESRYIFGIQTGSGEIELCTLCAEIDSKVNSNDTIIFTRS